MPNDPSRREFLVRTALATGGLLLANACGVEGNDTELIADTDEADGNDSTGANTDGAQGGSSLLVVNPESVVAAPAGRYPLGVAAGDITVTGAILWARYTPTTRLPLRVGVWEMDGTRYGKQVVDAPATRSTGGYVRAEVQLPPDRSYRYCFFEVENSQPKTRSPIGQVNGPPSTLRPVTIGAMACTKQGFDLATIARAGERNDLDLFLLLGDTSYCDGAVTRDEYRAKWTETLSTPEYRALRSATAVVGAWDDHDVKNNWDPESIDAAQLAAARGAFLENLPIRPSVATPDRLWRQLSYGPGVDLFVLDVRSERRKSQRQLISPAQLDWLKVSIAASKAVFKLVVTSVPIGDFPWPFDFVADSRWAGFPAQRTELLSHIEQTGTTGVFFLAGDFHLGSVGRVSADGPGSRLREVLCGPGAQRGNPLWRTLGSLFDFKTGTNNYTLFRLDPTRAEAVVTFYDGRGSVLFERGYGIS